MPKSPSSYLFPDINLWLALSYDRHVHHRVALAWFKQTREHERICFCRFTQLGLLRLLSTKAVMEEDGFLSQAEAWKVYDRWLVDERILLLKEPVLIESQLRELSRGHRPEPKVWSDAYLAAFAGSAGLRLVTFDQSFRSRAIDVDVLG